MEQALPAQKAELWRERHSRFGMDNHAKAFVEFVEIREDWALQNIAYVMTASGSTATLASSSGRKSFEKKEAKVMAVKATKGWTPDHPWTRPCIVE
jgi:hypothetical protein